MARLPFFCLFLLAAGAQFSFIELPIESLYSLYCSVVHSLQTCNRVSYCDDRNRLWGNNSGATTQKEASWHHLMMPLFFSIDWFSPVETCRSVPDPKTPANNEHFPRQHWSTLAGLIPLFNPWTPSPPREWNTSQTWITATSCIADVSAREDNHTGRLGKQQEGWQLKSQKHWHPRKNTFTLTHSHVKTGRENEDKTRYGCEGSVFLSAKLGASLDDDEHGRWFQPSKLWPSLKEMRGSLLKAIQSAGSINLIFFPAKCLHIQHENST